MTLDVNNSITSTDNSELRAQNGATNNKESSPVLNIERSYFKQLERGPAKVPPKLDKTFNLEESLNKAFEKAITFANRTLLDDDMTMTLQDQDDGKNMVIVKNIQNEQVVQKYDPLQVLQMYSSNYNLQGIVVDAII